MSFASIYFLFLFLPAVLLSFYILPYRNWRNTIIAFASLGFFGWVDPTHLPVLIASVLINYFCGILIGHYLDNNRAAASRYYMIVAVIINIIILCFYKYLGFFGKNIQALTGIPLNIKEQALPLGISYFTFSGISYILDIYLGVEKAEKNILRFSSYIIMFPKLLQGPITRFKEVKNELLNFHFVVEDVMQSVRRFIIGLAKKVILADSLAIAANKVFETNFAEIGASVAWFGLIAYTLQIYFDFSGYTDMAIGLGGIFGIKLPENFNYPYISRSITDFWRRWHMSLTSWFRNYVFIPLEFARKKDRILRQQSDIMIVFLLTGLWHGASWNFVIWGGYYGLVLAVEASGLGKLLKRTPRFFQHFYSISLIMLGWTFFRLTNFLDWGPFFKALFGAYGWTGPITLRSLNILFYIPIVLLAVLFCTPLISRMEKKLIIHQGYVRALVDILYLVIFFLGISYILSKGFTPFMYAQF